MCPFPFKPGLFRARRPGGKKQVLKNAFPAWRAKRRAPYARLKDIKKT